MSSDLNSQKLSFEEYKLYYDSTEKVTERRLSMNRWNYSICTAILTVNIIFINWAISNPRFFIAVSIFIIIICIMAILFCTLWIGQISSFKMLNTAKFDILNRMAPSISFSFLPSDERVSYSPFEKEWEILQEKSKALEELSGTNILVLKSSNIEYLIPKAFRFIFGLIIFSVLVLSFINWGTITESLLFQF